MISRLVPENHIIEVIGELISITKIVIVGNWSTAYGKMISKMYKGNSNLIKIESQYDQKILNSLRQGSGIYVHGHSVGGTNPGLLQAMAANCKIIAHDNIFNRSVMENEGAYFELGTPSIKNFWLNKNSISQKWEYKLKHYRWEEVSDQYYVISRKLAERDY
jgi:glycosyltransferase involved in cell wall biosynthesis